MGIADIRVVQVMGWRQGEDGVRHYVPVSYSVQVLRDGELSFEDVPILWHDEDDEPPSKGAVEAAPGAFAGSCKVEI